MIYNKMSIVVPKYSVNRWDKDSIRPGPVGSVGDVNVQVMLRKSSIDMPERFDPKFSGKNAPWSGSNVSDGVWYGWTSGGREATVISKAMPNIQTGGKTAIGWKTQNIVAADRSRETKMTPLGRYGWDTTVGSVLKSKHTGTLFLPLPGGYEKSTLPRGSQFPRIIAESTGQGDVLPAADVNLTDPVFGDIGTIEDPGIAGCSKIDLAVDEEGRAPIWTPAMDDPRRSKKADPESVYPWRKATPYGRHPEPILDQYPEVGSRVWAWYLPQGRPLWRKFTPCAKINRPVGEPASPIYVPPSQRPMPGNQDRRNQDRKKDQEDEKNKKQKLR
jgi:hypothetical protein